MDILFQMKIQEAVARAMEASNSLNFDNNHVKIQTKFQLITEILSIVFQ